MKAWEKSGQTPLTKLLTSGTSTESDKTLQNRWSLYGGYFKNNNKQNKAKCISLF